MRNRLTNASFYLLGTINNAHLSAQIPEIGDLKSRLPTLVANGIIEAAGRRRHILSRRFHAFLGEKRAYTRKKGLDHNTNKALLVKHINDSAGKGAPLRSRIRSRTRSKNPAPVVLSKDCISMLKPVCV